MATDHFSPLVKKLNFLSFKIVTNLFAVEFFSHGKSHPSSISRKSLRLFQLEETQLSGGSTL